MERPPRKPSPKDPAGGSPLKDHDPSIPREPGEDFGIGKLSLADPAKKLYTAKIPDSVPDRRSGTGPEISSTTDPAETLYKAAGCLPMSIDNNGDVCLLVFQESRLNSHNQQQVYWIDAGGRREPFDTGSWSTAHRELQEETGNFFAESITEESIFRKLWIPQCKYVLFMLYIPYDVLLSHRFQPTKDLICLQWIRLRDLFICQRSKKKCYHKIPLHVRLDTVLAHMRWAV